jgi:hypothetical protein
MEGVMKIASSLILTCCILLLASCMSKPEDAVIGKWGEVGGGAVLEFFKDGTVAVSQRRSSKVETWGSYKMLDATRLRLELEDTRGATTRKVNYMATISKDELSVSDELAASAGDVKYQRIK